MIRSGEVDPEEETDEMALIMEADAIRDPWTVICWSAFALNRKLSGQNRAEE